MPVSAIPTTLSPKMPFSPAFPGSRAGTPLTQARPDSLSIRFSSTVRFPATERQYILDQLKDYRYGKNLDALLAAGSPFQVHFIAPTFIIFRNHHPQIPASGPFTGNCEELAWHLGHRLRDHYGSRMKVSYVSGYGAPYFRDADSSHAFLLVWPRERHRSIRKQLRQFPDRIPQGALLIDPSFGVVGEAGADPHVDRYRIRSSRYIQERTPRNLPPDKTYYADGHQSDSFPVGFLRDLIPRAAQGPEDPTLLHVAFFHSALHEPPHAALLSDSGPDSPCPVYRPDLEAALTPDSALGRFFMTLQTQLDNPIHPPQPQNNPFRKNPGPES